MSYQVIGVLGDSIANGYWDEEGRGWVSRLQEKILTAYPYQFGFNNMAQDGDRIFDAFHRLNAEALSRDIQILLISIGSNDLIRSPNIDSPLDVSPHLREELWRRLLDVAQKNYQYVLVTDLLPKRESDAPSRGWYDAEVYTRNSDVTDYNATLKTLCEKRNIPFIELFSKWKELNLAEYYHDSCHPNAKGHQLIADEIFEQLHSFKILGDK